MENDELTRSMDIWPMPKFYFQMEWDDEKALFQEVSGLDIETQVIEYRHGGSMDFATVKMPGIKKTGNVTLKKGVFKANNTFWDWFNKIKTNTVIRKAIIIKLLDESGATAMQWTLENAWPTKITDTDLKSDESEVAIECLEIAHEGITVKNGSN